MFDHKLKLRKYASISGVSREWRSGNIEHWIFPCFLLIMFSDLRSTKYVIVYPFELVFNLISLSFQILDVNPEDEAEEDGANVDLDSQRKGKCVVLKTSTRQVSDVQIVIHICSMIMRVRTESTFVCVRRRYSCPWLV